MTVYHALSLFFTGLVFYVSGRHIIDFYRPSKEAVLGRFETFVHLCCFGIFIGSLGDFLDNAYWGVAWTLDGLKGIGPVYNFLRNWFFDNGVVANIPFRQLSDLASNYCFALAFIKLAEALSEEEAGFDRFKRFSRSRYHRNLFNAATASVSFVTAVWAVSLFYGVRP